LLLRSLPSQEKGALLCMKGRFGFGEIAKMERLTLPLIRSGAGMEETGFEQAVAGVSQALQRLQAKYGNDCVAVAVSDRYTNEEAFLIKEYAEKSLKAGIVFSFGQADGGLADVLGRDASTAALDDLENTELAVVVAPEPDFHRSVAAMRIRRAIRKGASLLLLSAKQEGEGNALDDMADLRIDMGGELAALEQIAGALLDAGCGGGVEGRDALSASLAGAAISDEARAAAEKMRHAEKAVFVFEKNALTPQAARLVADIAILSGHADKPGSGVIQLLPGANSQGLANLGVRCRGDFLRAVEGGTVRGLLVFGEEIEGADLSAIEFLAVQDLHITEAARQADAVLPASSYAETEGSFTGADNKARELKAAVASPVAWDNMAQIKALAAQAGAPLPYESIADIRLAMQGARAPMPAAGKRLAAAKKDSLRRLGQPAANALQISFSRFTAEQGLQ
jgi:formate dehydrogenase major subunit